MIELEDIAYVRSGAADLPAAVRFATDVVGLELVASDEQGVAHLRADARHHCLALVAGRSGVLASGFTVADDDALEGRSASWNAAASRSGVSTPRPRARAGSGPASRSTTPSATGSSW